MVEDGNGKKSYFLCIVLPSSKLPDKSSYNVTEAARIFGVSRSTLFRMMNDGRVKYSSTDPRSTTRGERRIHRQFLIDYFAQYDDYDLPG